MAVPSSDQLAEMAGMEGGGLTVVACTWNLGAKDSGDDCTPAVGDFAWLTALCSRTTPDLVVVGLQEVLPDSTAGWAGAISEALDGFSVVSAEAWQNYFPVIVLEREPKGGAPVDVEGMSFTLDVGKRPDVGLKGCSVATIARKGLQLRFVSAHLEAGYGKVSKRNAQQAMLEARCRAGLEPHGLLVQMGDLNYRVHHEGDIKEPTKAKPETLPAFDNAFESLAAAAEANPRTVAAAYLPHRCQLWRSKGSSGFEEGAADGVAGSGAEDAAKAAEGIFDGFEEAPIAFAPTYKRALVEDSADVAEAAAVRFDRRLPRLPAWTDRVLWLRGGPSVAVVAEAYDSVEEATRSDHRPVYAVLRVSILG